MKAIAVVLLLVASAGCMPEPPSRCQQATDCLGSEHCLKGQCVPSWGQRDQAAADLIDADPSSVPPQASEDMGLPQTLCGGAAAVMSGELVLNEILVHVPPAPQGDANGDGVRDAFEDEFVELVNVSSRPLPVGGLRYASNGKVLGELPRGCLEPGRALVLFGGGQPEARDEAWVEVASSRFAFANSGGSFTLSDGPREVVRYVYAGSRPEAMRLEPELRGTRYVPHGGLSALSPGQCADGQPIRSGCPSQSAEEGADMGAADQ